MALFAKYKELSSQKDRNALKELIENADVTTLLEAVLPQIHENSGGKLLNDILKCLGYSEKTASTRRKFVEAILNALKKTKISNSGVTPLICRIIQDFPKYKKNQLVKIVEHCLNSIRSNDDNFFSWKDILPVALQVLEQEKYINHHGNEVSGAEYKSLIIKSICSQTWEVEILTPLATMFTDIQMSDADHELAIRALCDKILQFNHSELPPFVHQLLRFSRNHDAVLVIGKLQKYFTDLYARVPNQNSDSLAMTDDIEQLSTKEIQNDESTILYHIQQCALLDHSRLKDYLRYIKNMSNAPEFILNPFALSVLLQVSNIYEEEIYNLIKQVFVRKIRDDEERKHSAWLRQVLPDSSDIMSVLDTIIAASSKVRHVVITGLLDLAYFLLATPKPKGTDESMLHKIGSKIIQKLTRAQSEIVRFVLEHLASKIIEHGASSVTQYTNCLAYLCIKSRLSVLNAQVWISTLLDHLLLISGETATEILYATMPLMSQSSSIRDSLILILRKVLYRPGIEIRQMGVTGFLQFLTNLKIPAFSLSQSSSASASSLNASASGSIFTQAAVERSSQQPTTSDTPSNTAFCQEILSILQRCFAHEFQVRQHLYRGLLNAVLINPELADPVIDMLLTHLNPFYEMDEDVKPPLKFHNCSTVDGAEAVLEEPIGDLIFTLQKIYSEMAGKDLASIDQLGLALEGLSQRMVHITLDDLNLDDHTDVLENVPKAQQKVISLQLMVTTLEALIAFRINCWSPENPTGPEINGLFKSYKSFIEFGKAVTRAKKGEGKGRKKKNDTTINKKPRARAIKFEPTIIDVQTVSKLLSLLYKLDITWATEEQTAHLRSKIDFNQFVLRISTEVFQIAKNLKPYDRSAHWKKFKNDYYAIGELLYREITLNLDTIREFNEDVGIECLQCFKELIELMATVFSSDFSSFLAQACQIEATQGLPSQISQLILNIETLIEAFYNEEFDEDSPTAKIPLVMLETIASLIHNTPLCITKVPRILEWLQRLAQSSKIDTAISIIIIQLIVTVEECNTEQGKVVDEMSVEVSKRFGTVDKTPVQIREIYKIINDATKLQAHCAFREAVKNKIDHVSWVLNRLKSEQIVATTMGITDEDHVDNLRIKERSLCRQLSFAIGSLETLTNTTIPSGPNADMILKTLHQVYNLVNALTKYFCIKSSPQNLAFQSVKFTQVVHIAGKALKTTVYNLITHIVDKPNSGPSKSDAQVLKNKVMKDTKWFSKVICEIEKFNIEILALEKKTGVRFDGYIKQSITRDFRINTEKLDEGLDRLDATQARSQLTQSQATLRRELSSSDDDTETGDNDDRQSKRARRS